MSFFVKSSNKLQNGPGKYKPLKNKYKKEPPVPKKKRKVNQTNVSDDEINSSDDEELINPVPEDVPSSEDERETVQEKKLRLAKKYLKRIREEEGLTDAVDDPDNVDGITKRLKQDYLQQVGRWKISIANKCCDTSLDLETITVKAKEHKGVITCLCLSTDGFQLFSGSKNGSIVKWCVKTKQKVTSIPYSRMRIDDTQGEAPFMGHSASISGLAISGDGNFLCSSDVRSKCIHVWTNAATSLKHLHTFRGHQRPITALACHGTVLYTGSADRTIRVWHLSPDLTYVETVFGHQDAVGALAVPICAEGAIVSGGGRDGTLRLWKLAEESQLVFGEGGVGGERKASMDVVCFLTQTIFISGSDNGDISVWSTRRKKPLCVARAAHGLQPANRQPYWITALATVPNADLVVSGSNNGSIKLWSLGDSNKSLELMREIPAIGFVNSLEITRDEKTLIAVTGTEHKLGRWTVMKEAKNSIHFITLFKE